MVTLVMVVLLVETMPVGILVSAALDRSLHRRPRFPLRFTLFLVGVALPDLATIGGFGLGLIGDAAAVPLVMGGLMWGLALAALASFVLFYGPGSNPGPSDDGGDDFGPGDDRPRLPRPGGGIPLPDAVQSPMRLRGHPPARRAVRPRRPEPAPRPSRSPRRLPLPPSRALHCSRWRT